MQSSDLATQLAPYLGGEELTATQVTQIQMHLDLLLKWNARMNLTAVRLREEIVTRHFGESLFAARQLFPEPSATSSLIDVGAGAGFPGLPIAIARPNVEVTLLEAHGKKATFLKEAVRLAEVRNAGVVATRAENYKTPARVVTLRAVEHFQQILAISATLVQPRGCLAALVGSLQVQDMKRVLGEKWTIGEAVYFPDSRQRGLWIARRFNDH